MPSRAQSPATSLGSIEEEPLSRFWSKASDDDELAAVLLAV